MNQPTYPIPSREEILGVLRTSGSLLSAADIAKVLSVICKEHDGLTKRLTVMKWDGQIELNRKGYYEPAHQSNFIEDRAIGYRDGFDFFVHDNGKPDTFLSEREVQKAIHGGCALVHAVGYDRRGRSEGQIVETLRQANKRVIGRLLSESGALIVTSEDKRLGRDILIALRGQDKTKAGQVVNVEILEYLDRYVQPVGRMVGVLGEVDDPGMETEIAVRKHGVPRELSEPTQREAEALPDVARDTGLVGCIDLCDIPLVTIDGEDVRDFDDTVHAEPVKIGRTKDWHLIVAIADVSHYVRPGCPLDADTTDRATSVYLLHRVVPMLPERPSNGLYSLNPEVDRLCMVCDAVIAAKGEIKACQFYPAVTRSKARLTCNEVQVILSNVKGPEAVKRMPLVPHLQDLYELYQTLLKARHERGATDFNIIETYTICNAQGKTERILPCIRNGAHRLVEEYILTANVCAAEMLEGYKHPTLYCVYTGPTKEKLQALRASLETSGLTLGGGDRPQAADYVELMGKVVACPDALMPQTMSLRSIQQVVYSSGNIGHFGLTYPAHAHFTSPIHRYSDLLVHRSIKAILHRTRYVPALVPGVQLNSALPPEAHRLQAEAEKGMLITAVNKTRVKTTWHKLSVHCLANEHRVDETSRDVKAWLKCYFICDKLGDEFSGAVSAVTSLDIFVQLDELYAGGLAHVTELGSDYFRYDEARSELRGECTGIRHHLTDRVYVQLLHVNLDARRMGSRLIQGPSIEALRPAEVTDAPKASVTCQPTGATSAPPVGRRKPCQLAALLGGTVKPEESLDETLDRAIEEQSALESGSRALPPGRVHVKPAHKKQATRGTKPKGGAKTAAPRKVASKAPCKTKGR